MKRFYCWGISLFIAVIVANIFAGASSTYAQEPKSNIRFQWVFGAIKKTTQGPRFEVIKRDTVLKFGDQIKSPGMFRFELYEYIQRSAEPKGKRAIIWPDIDLTDPIKNNEYWRDFLRTYVFSLPCKQSINQDYILQVTCLCPNGKRLSTEFMLRQIK